MKHQKEFSETYIDPMQSTHVSRTHRRSQAVRSSPRVRTRKGGVRKEEDESDLRYNEGYMHDLHAWMRHGRMRKEWGLS